MHQEFDTPILLLIFNRPDVSQLVFNQIKIVKPKHLFIAADGPRTNNPQDQILCNKTRKIIEQVDWDCEVKTLFRNENLGCGLAVCSAISWFFEQVEEGIILEDDCLPEISFFAYCDELLKRYKEDESIFLISGTNMQNGIKRGDTSYYFSNYLISWGWASWRRAWKHFNYDIPNFDKSFKYGELNHAFQTYLEKSYWRGKVKQSVAEKNNIWDYQWCFAIWKNKGIAIAPNTNLIVNLGLRNNGSHNFLHDSIREPSTSNPILFPLVHPKNKEINLEADEYIYKNAFSHSIPRFYRLIKENGIQSILKYTLAKIHKK